MLGSFDKKRFRPLEALSALRALLRDPDDTAQVFRIIAALSGGARQRVVNRLRDTPVGQRLLREKQALAPLLEDRERLRALPEGSLGREYLHFCERHGITASGLIAASQAGTANEQYTWDEALVQARMRDAHDLWHVVTGYQTDLLGEASVLAFTVAQTKNPGVGLIVVAAFLNNRGPERGRARRMMADAFARGVRAAWFPAADWEHMLARPLAEVRRELRVNPVAPYQPIWPSDVLADATPMAAPKSRAA